MVCATSLTKDSFCGSIVSGSPPVLVFSSPFGSTAAVLPVFGELVPWHAVTIIETETSMARIDQRPERRWIIRSLQLLWRATVVRVADEYGGRHATDAGQPDPLKLGSLRLPHWPHPRTAAAERCRTAWDRVIVWSAAAQRQLRDSSDPVAFHYPSSAETVQVGQGVTNRHSRAFQVSGEPLEAGSTPDRARGATSTRSRWDRGTAWP